MRNVNRLKKIMEAAASTGTVVPAFNIPYLPMVEATAKALAKYDVMSMIEVARLEITKFEARSLVDVEQEYRKWADPRVTTLHLDHVPVIDEDNKLVDWKPVIAEAINLGYDSVMVDGSRLPLDENIKVTAEVVRMAHAEGVLVEAELGAVMGHSDGPMPPYEEIFAKRMGFTDPEEARIFVQQTGVDWLSVSIGSFHGAISAATKDQPKMPAKLDIERLKELKAATGIPLVLHGGSGVIPSYIDEAIANGMVKINIATDTRQPYERALASGATIQEAQEAVIEAIGKLVCDVYHLEGSASRLNSLVGD
ncbi:MAG: class II fructose-bisphosphate aldolase [Armatimonadota bacterium]